jgi:hypothetical protein
MENEPRSSPSYLGFDSVDGSYEEALGAFGGIHALLRVCDVATLRLDASLLTTPQTVEWLRMLPVDRRSDVTLFWPARRRVVRLAFETFLERFEDIWLPSSDDVIVVSEVNRQLAILIIDHEEQVSFGTLPAVAEAI